MTSNSNFANRAAAAVSAMVLSLVLIAGTVSVPGSAQARTAYVGQLA